MLTWLGVKSTSVLLQTTNLIKCQDLFAVLFFKKNEFWKAEKRKESERDLHFPNCHQGQDWAMPKSLSTLCGWCRPISLGRRADILIEGSPVAGSSLICSFAWVSCFFSVWCCYKLMVALTCFYLYCILFFLPLYYFEYIKLNMAQKLQFSHVP